MSFVVQPNTEKQLLSTPTTFYIHATTGVDGINNGQTVGTAFQSLMYCLIYIRDNYIIDNELTIKLLSNITIGATYSSLRGFEIGTSSNFISINIQPDILTPATNANNKTIFVSNINGFTFDSLNSELYFSISNINFISTDLLSSSLASVDLRNCKNINFIECYFEKIDLTVSDSSEVIFSGEEFDNPILFKNSRLLFTRVNYPIFYNLELRDNSYVIYNNCSSTTSNESKGLTISGVSNGSFPYISYFNCLNLGFIRETYINTATLNSLYLRIKDSINIFVATPLFNLTGGAVSFSNGSNYFVDITNSENIFFSCGSNTKFINSAGNRGLFINNLSEVNDYTDTRNALNLPITSVVNLLEPDAYYRGTNYRSSTGLTSVNQSTAVDELARRGQTVRKTITTTETLTNNSASIQHLLNSTGSNLNVVIPATPSTHKIFTIRNNSSSTGNLTITPLSVVVFPGNIYSVIFDGTSYISLNTYVRVGSSNNQVGIWNNTTLSYEPDLLTNSSFANMPVSTIKGRSNVSAGPPVDIVVGAGLSINSTDTLLLNPENRLACSLVGTIFNADGAAFIQQINLVNSSAARIISAPTSPVLNARFGVVDATGQASLNNITITFIGSSLYGVTNDSYILNINKASVQFIYTGATIGWVTI